MRLVEHSFQEFIEAIQSAENERDFKQVTSRVSKQLGFRWFAYLRLVDDAPTLISSYPKSWTDRYFDLQYQKLDPVVQRARREHDLFSWSGPSKAAGGREQRRFFEEAMTFGIRSGLTVPIRAGFGQIAALTLATDDRTPHLSRLVAESKDLIQLVGLYFHISLTARMKARSGQRTVETLLTQRERQCLAWIARGKTTTDIATVVGISSRTVAFHLENARRKFDAASIAQCVAEAMRRGLLP